MEDKTESIPAPDEMRRYTMTASSHFNRAKGIKHDSGKLRMELADPYFIEELAEALTYGSIKYDDDNWKNVDDAKRRYKGALMRHWYAYMRGELIDPESGLTHLQLVSANTMFLSYLERNE